MSEEEIEEMRGDRMSVKLCPKCGEKMLGPIRLLILNVDEEPATGELGEKIMTNHYRCNDCKVYLFYQKGKVLDWDWVNDHVEN
ncbi:unnamed protein product [marine sediment metagenome]|uniref:Uncharacterized protein n=1 Tax=marine sediment metagenome TaxID=412755 RepID=X0WEJ3_9ZZZZ